MCENFTHRWMYVLERKMSKYVRKLSTAQEVTSDNPIKFRLLPRVIYVCLGFCVTVDLYTTCCLDIWLFYVMRRLQNKTIVGFFFQRLCENNIQVHEQVQLAVIVYPSLCREACGVQCLCEVRSKVRW